MTHSLLAHGAWVEQVCRKNWTAMHEAAKVGQVDILMLLLRNGGQVNHRDVTGVTPLAVAAEHGHFHITEILLHCGQSENTTDHISHAVIQSAQSWLDIQIQIAA